MNNSKNRAIEKVDQVTNLVSSSPIVKGLVDGGLSLIPFLGTAISSTLDTRAFQLFEKNSRQFSEEIRRQIQNLDENKLNKEFIESDEFTSLLIETLSRNAQAHQREKVQYFATIFVNALTLSKTQIPFKEGFIRILDEMGLEHIKVLAFVYERTKNPIEQNEKIKDRVQVNEISEFTQIDSERIIAYCDQMVRFGLLRDWALGKYGYQRGNYAITGYGLELAEFLQKAT